ncbi:regulatory protein [Roseibium sp. TrichSKD4]|nr:regulatory protein [Roseibium sp. TrichSKD4]
MNAASHIPPYFALLVDGETFKGQIPSQAASAKPTHDRNLTRDRIP